MVFPQSCSVTTSEKIIRCPPQGDYSHAGSQSVLYTPCTRHLYTPSVQSEKSIIYRVTAPRGKGRQGSTQSRCQRISASRSSLWRRIRQTTPPPNIAMKTGYRTTHLHPAPLSACDCGSDFSSTGSVTLIRFHDASSGFPESSLSMLT